MTTITKISKEQEKKACDVAEELTSNLDKTVINKARAIAHGSTNQEIYAIAAEIWRRIMHESTWYETNYLD